MPEEKETQAADDSQKKVAAEVENEAQEDLKQAAQEEEVVDSAKADTQSLEGPEVTKKPASQPKAKKSYASKNKKKKLRRQVQRGKVYVSSSYNNTKVSFADIHGNVLAWSSAGFLGFKGAKKATTYAANQVLLDANEKVQRYGMRDVEVFVKGVGSGRDAALRALAQKGYNIVKIKDTTPIPHNGCRPPKPRRV
jgi:small subunit ribosomal protein S11